VKILINKNIKNKVEIKNTMQDCGDHYLVKLSGGKEFLRIRLIYILLKLIHGFLVMIMQVATKMGG